MERHPTSRDYRYMMSGARNDDSIQEQSSGFDHVLDDPQNTGWSFARPPLRTQQRGGPETHVSGSRIGSTSQSLRQTGTASKPSRLSLAPTNIYSHQEELQVAMGAENYFKVRQNLHQSIPYDRASVAPFTQPASQLQVDSGSPIPKFTTASSMLLSRQKQDNLGSPLTQIANGMLFNQQISRGRPSEPVNIWQHQQMNKVNQLQPQRQQVTPPFRQGAYPSVGNRAFAQSSSPTPLQPSSPTERIITRRNVTRPLPQSQSYIEDADPMEKYSYSEVLQSPSSTRPNDTISLSHAPPMIRGIQLVSPHELPDRLRHIFPYELFNAVQSKCFHKIYRTNDNAVISAPTGSGKTAVLELAICRLIENNPTGDFKIVYQAPTKSLCSERLRDWEKKFSHLNFPCAELTGDTNQKELAMVRNAKIIVTTPEKWDSITRKWVDHDRLVEMVKLFLIDEVHILKDTRGATLEAIVSRMKKKNPEVRFVALSATVPNSHDIAVWLGKGTLDSSLPAHRETFGEDFRPVKLQKYVHGYESNNTNDFVFEKILDGKLPGLIAKYSEGKPIMVFCFTRKSCESTAALLADWWTRQTGRNRAWPASSRTVAVQNKNLQELVVCGVAFHHGGLEAQDRTAIEANYLKGQISVICCTSTLAVGVNLPCHLVVLKGTVGFQNATLSEYADLEVMQMLGRAGRPQFDDSAVAVIMTRKDKEDRYNKMVSGQDILESTLHLNLIEHLNSEIGLRTIHSVGSAKEWLKGTFLGVRMRQNPFHYKIDGIPQSRDTDHRLELVCERTIKLLREAQLITDGEIFQCTDYGQAMSRYMVQFETMKLLLAIPKKARIEEILQAICQAVEFKDLRIKPVERPHLREFNKSAFMKYPIKENIATTSHKIMLMVQVQLGGIDPPNDTGFNSIRRQFNMDTAMVMERIGRLIRCVVECKSYDCDAISTRHALDLARSLSAQYWENSNLQLRQLAGFGSAMVRRLAGNNITSIEALRQKDTSDIERILSKNPPYGRKILDQLEGFPRLKLHATITKHIVKPKLMPKVNVLATLTFHNKSTPIWRSKKPSVTFTAETTDGKLVHFWRGNIMKLERSGFEVKFNADVSGPHEEITCYLACEEIVGTLQSLIVRPSFPDSAFPLTPPTQRAQESEKGLRGEDSTVPIDSDEYSWDFGDDVLLEAVKELDASDGAKDSNEFADIDDFEHTTQNDNDEEENMIHESVRMPNGKWTCNHACGGGHGRKNGKKCKHKCCEEGIDKPRKPNSKSKVSVSTGRDTNSQDTILGMKGKGKNNAAVSHKKLPNSKQTKVTRKTSKVKLSNKSSNIIDVDLIEVVDLANNRRMLSNSDVATRENHNSVQKDNIVQLSRQECQSSQPDNVSINCAWEEAGTIIAHDSGMNDQDSEYDFPLFDEEKASNEFDDVFEIIANHGEQRKEPSPGNNDVLRDEKGDSVADTGSETTRDSLRTPNRYISSFAEAIFDFDALEGNQSCTPRTSINSTGRSISSTSSPNKTKKREQPASRGLEVPKPKRTQLQSISESDTSCQEKSSPSNPSWLKEFDPELIEGLKGFVEFVD